MSPNLVSSSCPDRSSRPSAAAAAPLLATARVLEATATGCFVRLSTGECVHARPAFVVAYAPAEGDELLVARSAEGAFAIGVLDGRGRTCLDLPGDVTLRARGGQLNLTGDRGVTIESDEVQIVSRAMKVVADAAVHKLGSLVERVRGTVSQHLGARSAVIDGRDTVKARDLTLLTEETVAVNGKRIHLG
jgi:hypothetical protein